VWSAKSRRLEFGEDRKPQATLVFGTACSIKLSLGDDELVQDKISRVTRIERIEFDRFAVDVVDERVGAPNLEVEVW
jgi:hypothetical protein